MSSDLASGNTISVTIGNMRNPISTKPVSGFEVRTADSAGYSIESFAMELSVIDPSTNMRAFITPSTGIIN